jgi:hypothetical protein
MSEPDPRLIEGPVTTKTGKVLADADIQALADEAESGYDVSHLLGVVEPRLPGMPPEQDRETRPYEEARDKLTIAHGMTVERLRELRKRREEINAEIKLLVDEEELLTRMLRIARQGKRTASPDPQEHSESETAD